MFTKLKSKLARLPAGIAEYNMRRETHRQLSRMTDKELQDIGITRGDIHGIAYENKNPRRF